jgi:membrane associated rhomboid family serine protease
MHQASVGFQCPDCVHVAARQAPTYTSQTVRRAQTERPYVTYVLIALNVVAFLAEIVTMAGRGSNVVSDLNGSVVSNGVLYGPAVHAGEWWRLFTNGFLHAGLIHIGMNMFVLYIIGPQVESILGRWRYLTLYVAALLAGSLGVILLSPQEASLGASGAIFGLFGAAAAYQYSRGINMMRSGLGGLILLNLVITFAIPGISIGGHIGGLIGGAAVGWLMFQLEERQQNQWVGVAVGAALSVAFIVAAIALSPARAVLG